MSDEVICIGVVGAGAISDIYLKNMIGKFWNLRVKSISARHAAILERMENSNEQ